MMERRRNFAFWGSESLIPHFYHGKMEDEEAIVGGAVL